MKTSAIEVHDMLSVFSVDEVEKRIGEVPGVQSVTVNFAAGNATVRYDETQLEATDIKSAVRQRGFESTPPGAAAEDAGHEGHAAPSAAPTTPAPAVPTVAPSEPAAEGATLHNKEAVSTPLEPSPAESASGSAAPDSDAKKETPVPSKD